MWCTTTRPVGLKCDTLSYSAEIAIPFQSIFKSSRYLSEWHTRCQFKQAADAVRWNSGINTGAQMMVIKVLLLSGQRRAMLTHSKASLNRISPIWRVFLCFPQMVACFIPTGLF